MARIIFVLLLVSCSQPLAHQRRLGAIHASAARRCRNQPATCPQMTTCSEEVRRALGDWQNVSETAAHGDATEEAAAVVVAQVSERQALTACREVKP